MFPAHPQTERDPAIRRRFRCLLAALLLLPAGCKQSVLDPAGPIAASERLVLLDSLAIMLAIVVPVIVATLAFAWWFRASNAKAERRPEWAYSGRVELMVWSVPALVVMFLGGIAWISAHDLDPARPIRSETPPLELQVVSLDWKWLFIYPQQHVASLNHLVVPVGRPLHLSLTSASVMNVFFVPRIGSEIYTMNGMTTRLYLQADRPGVYPGLSAQFSGDGFPTMAFDLEAMPAENFDAWIERARSDGPALDEAAYRNLLKQSMAVQPATYRAVAPNLFDAVASQKLPEGEGPKAGRSGVAVHPKTAG